MEATRDRWVWPTLAALAAAVALGLTQVGLLDWAEGKAYDQRLRLLAPSPGRGEGTDPVAVITVDEETLARFGQWPLPRDLYARLLEVLRLGGARAVGFDLLLSEPDRDGRANDEAFAAAIAGGPPVVLGLAGAGKLRREGGALTLLPPWSEPLPQFLARGAAAGHLMAVPDPDGVLRRLPLWLETPRGWTAAFSTALVGAAGAHPAVRAGRSAAPGDLLLDFRRGTVPTYSFARVLDGSVSPEFWRGRVVVVGVTAAGLPDRYPTPLSVAGDPTPGVQLQALAVATLLSGGPRPAGAGWVGLLTFLAAALGVTSGRAGRWAAILVPAGLVGLGALGVVTLAAGYWLPLVPAGVALLGGLLLSLAWSLTAARRERAWLESVFRRYLSPEACADLLSAPHPPSLAGERVHLAVLFADLRGFTAFSATSVPEEAVAILNRYLTAMVEAVHGRRGTVDKFLGDGLMAFFGAPLAQPDYQRAAAYAALDLIARTEAVGRELAAAGRPSLRVGVGLASGEVLVGSVGTESRSDYTVIGNAVNLASRLQRLAQPGEIVSDLDTWNGAAVDGAGGREEDVNVEGWPEPVRVVRTFCDGGHSGGARETVDSR